MAARAPVSTQSEIDSRGQTRALLPTRATFDSNAMATTASPNKRPREEEQEAEEKLCRICFGGEEDGPLAKVRLPRLRGLGARRLLGDGGGRA